MVFLEMPSIPPTFWALNVLYLVSSLRSATLGTHHRPLLKKTLLVLGGMHLASPRLHLTAYKGLHICTLKQCSMTYMAGLGALPAHPPFEDLPLLKLGAPP